MFRPWGPNSIDTRLKVLLDMRPAFDGHSGIPQETRLLFRGLSRLSGVQVLGLIQSGNLPLQPGLPVRRGEIVAPSDPAEVVGRLSKVVVSLQQGALSNRIEWLRNKALIYGGPTLAVAGSLLGRKVPLTAFDPTHFKDFVWRSMFAKSLPAEDFDSVTSASYRILRWPWSALNALGVATSAMGKALYPRLDTGGVDFMIAETPFPGRVGGRTQMIVRYHDAMPLLMPHTVKNRALHRAMHFEALKRNARDGAWFACVSEATRHDLLSVLPEVQARTVTIPNMVSHHFRPEDASGERVSEVIWSRKNRQAPHEGGADIAAHDVVEGRLPYLLMVSTIEPRKNHQALLDAWELLRAGRYPGLNLVCVGALGWEHQHILQRFVPWLRRGGLHLLQDVPTDDLRLLYRHAAATVCPSFGEGFDFPGVEAMCSGGVVVASDIRVHRDVYADAAEYFDAYAPAGLAGLLDGLLDPAASARREALMVRGFEVAAQYRPERVLPQWQSFLDRLSCADRGRA
jgi:glycosyltransferase involved in cell wall biosynthesis